MFKNIFGSNENASKTGFFKVDKDKLIGIDEILGNGSINSCIQTLGFPLNHVRTVNTFKSAKIDCLGFKVLSKELVFVLAKTRETKLAYSEVQKEIKQIDWSHEYSSLNIEDILQDGIDMENFDLKFLKSVVDLREDSENVYKSEQLGLYLQFDNDILTAFTSTSFDNSATKWLANLNPMMIQEMTKEAKQYHQNDMDSMEEVNKQAKSLLGIPHAANNEFIPLHTKANGNVSFYNLLVTHYQKRECNIDEFLFMNKGRFRKINNNTIQVANFIYSFSTLGQLESVVHK
jgi:hypothetical protein